MNRFRLLFFCCLLAFGHEAQSQTIVKYYDSLWNVATKESAHFYSHFTPRDTGYTVYSYRVQNNTLFSRSVFSDTLFTRLMGLGVQYYEHGGKEDSTFFYDDGSLRETYHFYPSGKLWAHYAYDRETKKEISEGYDEQGKAINNFVYLKEASFPGGNEAWMSFLGQNLNTRIPIKRGAPNGNHQVVIRFVIDKKGAVTNVHAETSLGFGMEEEAMRVIRKSPRGSR